MTLAQDLSQSPSWLPLRVLCGSVVAAGVVAMMQKLPDEGWMAFVTPPAELWPRCGASFVVLVVALVLALSGGLAIGLGARRVGRRTEAVAAFLGRALACLPVAALAWGFVGVWTGQLGLPVETLMPAELPLAENAWQTTLARGLWEFLAPTLLLALPLAGEMVHAVIRGSASSVDLDFSLRARGVPQGARLWHHHLRQLLPLLRGRLQALCLLAPAYLIIVEDVLRFMGWGGWMAQAIRAADAPAIATGFLSGGLMVAALCGSLRLLRGRRSPAPNRLAGLAWLPWPLWMLGAMGLPQFSASPCLVLSVAVLLFGSSAWLDSWNQVAVRLPLDAARVLGASGGRIWRAHVAPPQFRMLLAWSCTVCAQTLLWIAAACVLQPRLVRELGMPLGPWLQPLAVDSPQDTARILADSSPLLLAGGGVALAALCLIQVSRIVQPRPS